MKFEFVNTVVKQIHNIQDIKQIISYSNRMQFWFTFLLKWNCAYSYYPLSSLSLKPETHVFQLLQVQQRISINFTNSLVLKRSRTTFGTESAFRAFISDAAKAEPEPVSSIPVTRGEILLSPPLTYPHTKIITITTPLASPTFPIYRHFKIFLEAVLLYFSPAWRVRSSMRNLPDFSCDFFD